MIRLVPMAAEDVEWVRTQRNRPELYRYFRQDSPITKEQQRLWWKAKSGPEKNTVRLFIVLDSESNRVGYVGFNPFNQYAMKAEFGIFIVPEEQEKGYGKAALLELLKVGFTQYRLSTIYSDVIDYPNEGRFLFYEDLGFKAFPQECQTIRYVKQGKSVGSIKFYMTKDMWEILYGKENKDQLVAREADAADPAKIKSGKGRRGRPSKNRLLSASK